MADFDDHDRDDLGYPEDWDPRWPRRRRPLSWDDDEPLLADIVDDEPDLPEAVIVATPHPGFWWAALWCLGYVVVTQLVAGIVGVVLLIVLLRGRLDHLRDGPITALPEFAQAMAPALLLAQVLGIVGSWLALRLIVGRRWPGKVALRLPALAHVILAVVALPGMIAVAGVIETLSRQALEAVLGNGDFFGLDSLEGMIRSWPWAFAVLLIGVGPGVGEELFCRGFLGRGLVGRYGAVGGVLLTSLFFALMHLEPRQVAYTFFMGLLLHASYLLTRSLLVPILLHTLNNSIAVWLVHCPWLVGDLGPALERGSWHTLTMLALGGLSLLAGVGCALYMSRARLAPRPDARFSWQPDFPSVEYPPPEAEADVIHPPVGWAGWLVALAGLLAFVGAVAAVLARGR
jgi:membrane protease YdiL (CAAX protease family)